MSRYTRALMPEAACIVLALIFLLSLSSHIHSYASERRVALVIGNANYVSVPSLRNPNNDARAVGDKLRDAGFDVVSVTDLDYGGMIRELQRFLRSLDGASISLLYYSGHGIQAEGQNRLIPIDAKLDSAVDLEVETIDVNSLLQFMRAHSEIQLVFLDACRDNPFPSKQFYVGKKLAQGTLFRSAIKGDAGSLIAYSTEPGNVALDGQGPLSPYTEAFLKFATKPDLDLSSAMMAIRREVIRNTSGQQIPWESNSLTRAVFLAAPAMAPPTSNVGATLPPKLSAVEEQLVDELTKAREIWIGVGPVQLLPSAPTVPLGSRTRLRLVLAPRTGLLLANKLVMRTGTSIAIDDMLTLEYEPQVGTENNVVAVAWELTIGDTAPVIVNMELKPRLHSCDWEAGARLDLQGVAQGRVPNEINPPVANAACQQAVADFPDVARFTYQLGRTELALGHDQDAIKHFHDAANSGHIRATYQLGFMQLVGLNMKQNRDEAARLFHRAAELGDPYGLDMDGRSLIWGWGNNKDIEAGTKLLTLAADLGNTNAMNQLGMLYFHGEVVQKNPERAIRFFRSGLEHKDLYSINNFGLAYLEGVGVTQDYQRALELFRLASDGGHPGAPTEIGRMFFLGLGVKKDLEQAIQWYLIAAERGETFAAGNLGWIYLHGPSSIRDETKAASKYALAVALDWQRTNLKAKQALANVSEATKAQAIALLMRDVKEQEIVIGKDLDETLVLLAHKAWLTRNPRTDLF